jgi:propionyl-CoA synthetase
MTSYREIHASSALDPHAFWLDASTSLDWNRQPHTALDSSRDPLDQWFPDGQLNVCHNALDRHVASGRGDHLALVYDSPVTATITKFTYAQLLEQVARCAGVLAAHGVTTSDRVVIYMPMIPEAVIAMLACARLGAVHSVVFGGFAAPELAARIDDANPMLIISATHGIEANKIVDYKPMLDAALRQVTCSRPTRIIVRRNEYDAPPGSDEVDWHTAMAAASPADPVVVDSTHPLYILYTSGTTGRPKGIVRDSGGYATALAWSMGAIFGVGSGEVMFTASDVGWVVGHSYIVYGPLLVGATTILYEGKPVGTPDSGAFGTVIENHRVTTMFTAPTAIRAIRRVDPTGSRVAERNLSSLRYLFLAGERLDSDTQAWAAQLFGVPVVDNWWQTETGWPVATNPMGVEPQKVSDGATGVAMPGWHIAVVDERGQPVDYDTDGAIVLRRPLPPGALTTIWNDDARYVSSYLSEVPGFYLTGDRGRLSADGSLFVMGRTDDVINVAGHRLSAGAIEDVLGRHPDVAECAVIGVSDPLKGQVPRGLVVLAADVDDATPGYLGRLTAEIDSIIRTQISPIATLKDVTVVAALPKTRSGKILRTTMRSIADGRETAIPSTIEDPDVLTALRPLLYTPSPSSR